MYKGVRLISKQNPNICILSKASTHEKIRFFHQTPAAGSDRKETATTQKGDVMSKSFGEGYSSRSDEEGFGGTNQSLPGNQQDNKPSAAEYDKTQGSQVKEKEHSRHQTN